MINVNDKMITLNKEKTMDRDDFMSFFRDDEKLDTLSVSDRLEIFQNILLGSCDITKEFLDELIDNYVVDGIEVLHKINRDSPAITSLEPIFTEVYTYDKFCKIRSAGVLDITTFDEFLSVSPIGSINLTDRDEMVTVHSVSRDKKRTSREILYICDRNGTPKYLFLKKNTNNLIDIFDSHCDILDYIISKVDSIYSCV